MDEFKTLSSSRPDRDRWTIKHRSSVVYHACIDSRTRLGMHARIESSDTGSCASSV